MTYLLVPGAGGDAWYWHLLVPLLREHADVVAVDLPAGDETAGLAAYADAIVAAADDARDITLVAQSMGGLSAPLAADRLDVRRIVLVNAMVPRPGEPGGKWWAATGQADAARAAAAREGRDPDASFDPFEVFLHDVPDAVRAEALSRGESAQSGTPFADPWPLDAWPDVPTTAISGRHDRLFPMPFQQRLLRDRLGIEPTVVEGGHLVALANPAGLATALATQNG